jgi:hypothetical protein
MWPFKSKKSDEFRVTIIRKKISNTRESYIFKGKSKEHARLSFLLWWWQDKFLNVEQKPPQHTTHEIAICDAPFLRDIEKRMIERHITKLGTEFSPAEKLIMNQLMNEWKQADL